MKKLISFTSIIILFFSITVFSQQEPTVTIKQSTANACDKAFDEVIESRSLIRNLLDEKAQFVLKEENYKKELSKKDGIISNQEEISREKDKKITILENQKCSTTSLLWGIIKFKKC
jgi:hypothetical protein